MYNLKRMYKHKYRTLPVLHCEVGQSLRWSSMMRPHGGGGFAPLIPENNTLISPTPWKKVPLLPENISFAPQILKINLASPQIPQKLSQFSLKLMESITDNRYLWCCIFYNTIRKYWRLDPGYYTWALYLITTYFFNVIHVKIGLSRGQELSINRESLATE